MIRKGQKFELKKKHKAAFELTKDSLTKAPVLSCEAVEVANKRQ